MAAGPEAVKSTMIGAPIGRVGERLRPDGIKVLYSPGGDWGIPALGPVNPRDCEEIKHDLAQRVAKRWIETDPDTSIH